MSINNHQSQYIKWLTLGLGFSLILGIVMLSLLTLSTQDSQANLPQGALDLKVQLETASNFKMNLRSNILRKGATSGINFVFRADDDGNIALDEIDGLQRRYTYTNNVFKLSHRKLDNPVRKQEYEAIVSDLYNYIRSGSSTWIARDPEYYGLPNGGGTDWTEIDIPFSWAAGTHVFLSFHYNTSTPDTINIFIPTDSEAIQFRVTQLEFNSSFQPNAFNPQHPPFNLPFDYDMTERVDGSDGGALDTGLLEPVVLTPQQ
jgi:hypothetical protein